MDIYIYIYIWYIYIHNANINDTRYYFLRMLDFHVASATVIRQMNCNDQIYNVLVSNNDDTVHATCIYKIHLLVKFIETEYVSVNLLHKDSEWDCYKLTKFQETSTFIWCFSQFYRNLPRRIYSYFFVCWLFRYACSANLSLHK